MLNVHLKYFAFKIFIILFSHIEFDRKPENTKIYTGSNRLRAEGTWYNVEKFIIHEKYNKPDHKNDEGWWPANVYDVALIRVKGTIKFNNKTQPIKYSKNFIKAGTDVKMTGWGWNRVKLKFLITLRMRSVY